MKHECPTHGAEYDCPIPKNCTHPRVVNCPPCHRKTGQLYPPEDLGKRAAEYRRL